MSTETSVKSTSTATEISSEDQWGRVRETITQRWPHVNRDELADCPNDSCQLTNFVKQRVDESEDDIRTVISEFAPQESLTEQMTQAVSDTFHRASDSIQQAYTKADDCIAERPTESVLASFVAGVVVGGIVMAAVMRSKPEPTVWDRVTDRRWS